jgi:MOSC domain-containing protein YiiM
MAAFFVVVSRRPSSRDARFAPAQISATDAAVVATRQGYLPPVTTGSSVRLSGMPKVEAVNVGRPRPIERSNGNVETSAIWKEPVSGRVAVRGVNVDGDDQADRSVHGGPDRAVYAYAAEDTEWWESELGRELGPGTFGENLTLRGVDVTGARVGERWRIGSAVLEVTSPRVPCWKLAKKMDDPRFIKRFAAAGRPGAYLRIIEEGELGPGDEVKIVERPEHDVTLGLFAEAYEHDRTLLPQVLEADALPAAWRDWIEEVAGRYSSTK